MIDINLLRKEKGGNVELVKESQRKRGGDKAVALVDQVLVLDQEWITGTHYLIYKLDSRPTKPTNKST